MDINETGQIWSRLMRTEDGGFHWNEITIPGLNIQGYAFEKKAPAFSYLEGMISKVIYVFLKTRGSLGKQNYYPIRKMVIFILLMTR